MLLESLLDNLAARQKDSCASVRRLVLRGLANVATGSPDKVSCPARPAGPARGRGEGGRLRQRGSPGRRAWRDWDTAVWPPQVRAHGPQLLTAMIGGLDDGDAAHSLVALEAMVGLARLLDLVEAWDLRSVLLHVAIRIRPFFDSVGGGGGNPRPCNPARGVLSHMPTTPPPPPRGMVPAVDQRAGLGRAPGADACRPRTPGKDGVPCGIHPPLRAPQQGLPRGL